MGPPAKQEDKPTGDDRLKVCHRKTNKPLIEKRRRARINECLSQLKTIVLGEDESKTSRSSKLEKADILEMTVEFVKQKLSKHNEHKEKEEHRKPSHQKQGDYMAGYTKCLSEISRFLEQGLDKDASLKTDIVNHMHDKMQQKLTATKESNIIDIHDNIHNPQALESIKSTPIEYSKCPSNNHDQEMPVDLRKHATNCDNRNQNEEPCDPQIRDCITDNRRSESRDPQSNGGKDDATDHMTQTQTPIGCLYGGQVLLLVQPSQLLASHPMTSASLPPIAHQQIVTSPFWYQQVPVTMNSNKTQIKSPSMETLQEQPGFTPFTNTIDSHLKQPLHGVSNVQLVNLILPTEGSGQYFCQGVSSSHWRPW